MLERLKWTVSGIVLLTVISVAQAAEWGWPARFTEASSPALVEAHSAVLSVGTLEGRSGVAVKDVTWEAESFALQMTDGVVYLEPELEGVAFGAFFVGQAEVSLEIDEPRVRGDLERYFGAQVLDGEPIDSAYFFTLTGSNLLQQLGVEDEADVPFEDTSSFAALKDAARQMGMRLTHAFLDRAGSARGASYVIFTPRAIREKAPEALLMFSVDPTQSTEVELSVFGHDDAIQNLAARRRLERDPDFKYQFWPVTAHHARDTPFIAQADVEQYTTQLVIGRGERNAEQTTTILMQPAPGVSLLRFELTPRLEVQSVTGPDGEALEFAQWRYLNDRYNFDRSLLVRPATPPEAGAPYGITVVSQGQLFDSRAGSTMLAEEDAWHPRTFYPDEAIFDSTFETPKNVGAVGAGALVAEHVEDGRRTSQYRTTRPAKMSSFYIGNFDVYKEKADDTSVEFYYDSYRDEVQGLVALPGVEVDVMTLESPKYTVTEVANAVKVYNRILGHPLEQDHLRVVTTPTYHGRGFEGIILLAKYGGTSSDSSAADLFRAHEVAHQWWGNMVRGKDWPEDRWLSESFAEYSAMEYYAQRFRDPDKVRQRIQENWWQPLFRGSDFTVKTLSGEHTKTESAEVLPLIAGGGNVYTKGPLVLHSLRYLCEVHTKSEDAFWTLLQDFIEKFKYRDASTADFMALAEQHMQGKLDWFWNQWIYGTQIPKIRWSYEVVRAEDGGWAVNVEAEQQDTEFVMPIPIYIHVKGGDTFKLPLIMRGKQGTARARLRNKPTKITINDNYEALAEFVN